MSPEASPASMPVSDGSESARIAGLVDTPQTPSRVDEPGHRPQDPPSGSRADGSAPGLATTGATPRCECGMNLSIPASVREGRCYLCREAEEVTTR